jgi:PhnB protein
VLAGGSSAFTTYSGLVASIQPELWVHEAGTAVRFYAAAFGAKVLHLVGDGEDVVAQLDVDGAVFWVAAADAGLRRLSPAAAGGATGRTLLVVEDPDEFHARAVSAGATSTSPVADEHGWRVGRLVDPFGHEWEIGRQLGG